MENKIDKQFLMDIKLTLMNTEGAIKNGKSRETGNIGYRRRRNKKTKTKTKQHNICWTRTTMRKRTQTT